jgi:hypothetical protein
MAFGGIGRGTFSLLILAGMLACGPDAPKKKTSHPEDLMGSEDPNVDVRQAKQHIEKAVSALRNGKLEAARKALAEAEPFADEIRRDEISRVRQSVDSAEADKYIPGINEAATSGKCEEAVAAAVEIIDAKKGAIPLFVRDKTSKKILKCLLDQLAVDLSIGRELSEDKKLARVLDKASYQELITKVTDATVKELIGRFDEPLGARDWAKAKELLDELVQRKEAGDNEYNRIMDVIRKGIAEDVLEKVDKGLGEKSGVAKYLTEVDALVALAEWGEKKGSAAAGTPMPEEVEKGRDALALWSVCSGFKCNLVSPSEGWTYGHMELKPALSPTDDALETIKHGTRLWKIADSSSWILVAKKDPGALDGVPARLAVAAGWIKSSGMKTSDTAEMLPPGDSIVGTRVWGPLRDGEPTWELGKVMTVKGSDLGVERIADGNIVTLARSKVRFGTLSKGTKVLARCSHPLNLEPAIIESVEFPKRGGDPVATIACLGADGKPTSTTRQELIGALRSKPAWLPAAK